MYLQRRSVDSYLSTSTIIFIAWAVFIVIALISTCLYRSKTNSQTTDNDNSLIVPLANSRNSVNSDMSSEFIEPLPLYTPPMNSNQLNADNSPSGGASPIRIEITEPTGERIDRPPTYRNN
ncbi:hypothetical protein CONCODRAFT_80811 [Conidiobolus coronatus NRRL 28638]|uniref:Uncharacterized protein n=1 Tax=Conidiobolus coronatus (strain ATCC 28846 / CBS 209.66 / NRRL 28638) TaxID=796925 RepID=A0A137NRD3_CONC2|nr:hypothetical protein CONCODRAFT_80811 [Conidiobolus coronatus NRRL 28638]|eukprot:KXN65288.1 hypothetical protein CONCODRAFT_80811 [Conidiobolus coronatus NRRL 28638]